MRRVRSAELVVLVLLTVACSPTVQRQQEPAPPPPPLALDWDHLPPGTDIAHRGGALLAPENTMAAFLRAAELGVPIEADVRLLADGTAVLFHDDTLDRTTNGSGPVAGLTADQYDRLVVDAAPGPATGPADLEDLLSRFEGELLLLEAKAPGSMDPLLDVLDAHGVDRDTVLVASFDPAAVLAAERRGWDTGLIGSLDVAQAATAGIDWLMPHHLAVTTDLVTAAHAAGLRVAAWTVNDLAARAAMIATGVDAVVTDAPRAAPRP